jgi:exopolysaccharide biosynthesis polyprenyl glycosylphosphotransferase
MLAMADVIAALVATLVLGLHGGVDQLTWALLWVPVWVVLAKVLGLYDGDQRSLRHLTVDEVPLLIEWTVFGTIGLSLFLLLTPAEPLSASDALSFAAVVWISALVLRVLARRVWRAMTPPERIAIFGSGPEAGAFRRKLELFRDLHMRIVEEHDASDFDQVRDREWLGAFDRLVFTPSSLDQQGLREIFERCREAGVRLTVVPPHESGFGSSVRLTHLAELPILEYETGGLARSTLFLKRAFDLFVSSVMLVVLLPLFCVIAVAIKLDSRGPAFYRQMRAGEKGRPFRVLKFRSMVANAEELLPDIVSFDSLPEPVFKLHNDRRVTRCGRLLRRWSLDELPQLWNVLIGDMSLVGPRPEQLDLVERYSVEERLRLEPKPGITGPMQVYGRGELTLAERIAVERDYIENLSVGRDLRMIALTVGVVLRGQGAY